MFNEGAPAPETADRGLDDAFASSVLETLAALADEPADEDSLVLALSLSLSMRRSEVAVPDAIAALLSLRVALVRCAGLDEKSEPTPLVCPDGRTSLLSVARYLLDLVSRAAAASDCTALEITGRARDFLPTVAPVPQRQGRIFVLAGMTGS